MQDVARRQYRWLGPALFALSFIVYCLTLSPGAYPGESARLIVQHSGLDPFPPMSHPLWNAIVRTLALLPVGTLVLRLNLFSALCGALSVWLVYVLTARISRNRTYEEVEGNYSVRRVRAISGAVAGIVLAFCVPFWMVSTRAHTASFDVLLLLTTTYLLVRFAEQPGRTGLLYSFALLYGLGFTEFGTLILLMPVFAAAVALILWQNDDLRAGRIAGAVGCFAAGLLVYGAFGWQYWLSPARVWRGFHTFFDVLWFIWREQYRAIAKGVPQIGWLLVFLVTVAPGIMIFAFPKRLPNRAAMPGSLALQAVLTALGVAVVLDAMIAPWPLLKWSPLLVTPYVFVAVWLGYLAGYWYVIVASRDRYEPPVSGFVRRVMHVLYYPLVIGLLVTAFLRNIENASGRRGEHVLRLADGVVEALDGRSWLISNGIIDDNVLLKAAEKGIDVRILSLTAAGTTPYLEYVASLFDDPRLKGLARVGLSPLFGEWFATTPDIEQQVAVFTQADLWLAGGIQDVPRVALFQGTRDMATVDADALMAEHREWWDRFTAAIGKEELGPEALMAGWNRWALGHVGKVANNLGVFFEDAGRDDLAFETYTAARGIDTNNISALLNKLTLAARTDHPEKAAIEAECDAVLKRLGVRLNMWSLAYHYGYVRHPDAYLTRGMAWAMSGKRNLAIADVQKAMRMGGRSDAMQMTLASLYFSENMTDESEAAFSAIVEKNPKSLPAILGLARVAMRKGDFDSARGYLRRLRDLNFPEGLLRLEEIALESLLGNSAAARAIAEDLVKQEPQNLKAWTALAILAAVDGDTATTDTCVAKLEEAGGWSPSVRLAVAQIAFNAGKSALARKHLESLLQAQPSSREVLELLLELDRREGLRDKAEEHIERLLGIDPSNALANYFLGGLQMLRGEYALAEASLRVSLASRRTAETLNELAWVLQKRGAYEEALPLAREAVELNAQFASAWDTLGVALLRLGQLDEAQQALQRALEIRPDNLNTVLHTAELHERRGEFDTALRMTESLLARPSELAPDAAEEARDLVGRLRQR